jgi:hypothetical protein
MAWSDLRGDGQSGEFWCQPGKLDRGGHATDSGGHRVGSAFQERARLLSPWRESLRPIRNNRLCGGIAFTRRRQTISVNRRILLWPRAIGHASRLDGGDIVGSSRSILIASTLKRRIGIEISHRFSTVRIADRIAVIADGHLTELGTHDELLRAEGRYAQLFELQAAGYR